MCKRPAVTLCYLDDVTTIPTAAAATALMLLAHIALQCHSSSTLFERTCCAHVRTIQLNKVYVHKFLNTSFWMPNTQQQQRASFPSSRGNLERNRAAWKMNRVVHLASWKSSHRIASCTQASMIAPHVLGTRSRLLLWRQQFLKEFTHNSHTTNTTEPPHSVIAGYEVNSTCNSCTFLWSAKNREIRKLQISVATTNQL